MDPGRLRKIKLFEGLTDEQLQKLAPFAAETSAQEGKVLVNEGDYSYELMAIEEGSAKVTRGDEEVAELGPGDFFGEMGLISKELRNATVSASSPVRLITFNHWDLKRMERTAPEAVEKIREVIEQRKG
jgi:CRP/FNR family cyclic AMP-dependent transcriptional regulator